VLSEIRDNYEKNGSITWSEFSIDQENNKNKVVLLKNNNFKYGTLRIHVPCMLKLTENITFNPNRPETWLDINNEVTYDFNDAVAIDPDRIFDWFPDINAPKNAQYFEPEVKFAYSLGFFAAIAVEEQDVFVNLNGFLIEQSPEFTLQQKFYSHIELSDQPFIPLQGPTNFGAVLRSAKNCWIFNGTLGRSSHHCIHGNSADDILIEDAEFHDYEVAACSLNGTKNIFLDNTVITGNKRDVPVLGTYSAGRIIRHFVRFLQDNNLSNSSLNNATKRLKLDLDKTFNSFIFNKGAIPKLFANPFGLMDGNTYGYLINPKGVAVNSFLTSRNSCKANETANIYLNNVSVNGVHGRINEIVAIGTDSSSKKAQVDTAGATLQFFNSIAKKVGNKYYYSGTSLSNVQIELAKIKTTLDSNNQPSNFLGTLNIGKGIQLWKSNSTYYFIIVDNKLKLLNGAGHPMLINNQEVIYEILCNGDSMFHVNKGAMGARIDGANKIYMNNCTITDIKNIGSVGSTLSGHYIESHPGQGIQKGFTGNDAYGAIFSGINDLKCKNLNVNNVESINGSAYGVRLQNDTCNCSLNNTKIANIKSNIDGTFNPANPILPNKIPISRGISIGENLFNINLNKIEVVGIQNANNVPFDLSYDINSHVNMK
jgi:hypothetical protein